MGLSSVFSRFFQLLVSAALCAAVAVNSALAAGRETPVSDLQFQPVNPPRAVTIREAVAVALRNFPEINQKLYKLRAAKGNIALAKTQYLPNINMDLQISAVSPNRLASVVMNNVSGFDTVPVDSGPVSNHMNLSPQVNSLQGLNLNWLAVDYGMRKANDRFAYADAKVARSDLHLTKLDVAFAAADAFLSAVASKQLIRSNTAALDQMEAADLRARTLVAQGLRPGVDAADWRYELCRARINLIKAEKELRLSLVDLSERMGVAWQDLDIISEPLLRRPVETKASGPFNLASHPLALTRSAEVQRWRAKQDLLDIAYRPHLWLNASMWGKGSSDNKINPIHSVSGGVLPQIFDYMVGVSYSFPFMEYFPLQAQKEMARSNELAARADFDLAMQILEKKDLRSRILLEQSTKVACETPKLVEAAQVRENMVFKRYSTGLTNMVSLAEAEKALVEAQVEDAVAQVEVWRSILSLAYVQGDLAPFLRLVEIAEGSTEKKTR